MRHVSEEPPFLKEIMMFNFKHCKNQFLLEEIFFNTSPARDEDNSIVDSQKLGKHNTILNDIYHPLWDFWLIRKKNNMSPNIQNLFKN